MVPAASAPEPSGPSLQRLVFDLQRLERDFRRIQASNEPGKARRLAAVSLAYDETLRACCLSLGLDEPAPSPLSAIDRLRPRPSSPSTAWSGDSPSPPTPEGPPASAGAGQDPLTARVAVPPARPTAYPSASRGPFSSVRANATCSGVMRWARVTCGTQ